MISKKKLLLRFSVSLLTIVINSSVAFSASNDPVLLSNPGNTGFERFRIDPSSQYVVFNEFDSAGILNRFSRKIDGQSPAIEIASDLSRSEESFFIDAGDLRVFSRNGDPTNFISTEINNTSNNVIYSIFNSSTQEFENLGGGLSVQGDTDLFTFFTDNGQLFSIPNDGNGTPIDYTETLNTISFGLFRVTDDGLTLFFSTEIAETSRHQLFSTNLDGSSDPVFITELPESTDIDFNVRLSSDNQRVVYITETFLDNSVEILQLFSAPLDGSSEPITLSDPFIGSSTDIDFFLSGNGTSVVYVTEDFINDEEKIYIAAIDGSFETRLIDTSTSIPQFEESSDNQNLIYSIDNPIIGPRIKTVSIDQVTPVSADLIADNVDLGFDFALSSESDFVFYVNSSLSTKQIFRTSINASSPITNVVGEQNGFRIQLGSDLKIVNNKLFFIGFSFESGNALNDQLYSASFDGSEISQISSFFNNDGEPFVVSEFDISDDGSFAVYIATNDFTGATNLFTKNLEASEPFCFPIKAQNGNFVTICL